jgi:hypothetical protein
MFESHLKVHAGAGSTSNQDEAQDAVAKAHRPPDKRGFKIE